MLTVTSASAGTPPAGPVAGWMLLIWQHRVLYLMLLPFAVLTLTFGLWPIVLSIVVSFTESQTALSDAAKFVGLENFRAVAFDPEFHHSLALTLLYTAVSVVLNLALALALALALSARTFRLGATFYKLALFMPVVTPEVATFIVWKWMLNQDFGAVNAALASFGLPAFAGTTKAGGAFLALVVVELWHHVGFYTLVFLTNLQLLDASLDEAARMDGAGRGRRIWSIWIPQLRPAIAINALYALISFLKTFTAVIVITKGGPNFATNFVSYYAYTKFDLAQYGEATAMATILFIIVLALTLLLHLYSERKDYR